MHPILFKVQKDLKKEYFHMHVYMYLCFSMKGINRLLWCDFLEKQYKSEMEHVKLFSDKLASFGYSVNVDKFEPVPIVNPDNFVEFLIDMEKQQVQNYIHRIQDLESELSMYDLKLFYEEQLEDSQNDIDEMSKIANVQRN